MGMSGDMREAILSGSTMDIVLVHLYLVLVLPREK